MDNLLQTMVSRSSALGKNTVPVSPWPNLQKDLINAVKHVDAQAIKEIQIRLEQFFLSDDFKKAPYEEKLNIVRSLLDGALMKESNEEFIDACGDLLLAVFSQLPFDLQDKFFVNALSKACSIDWTMREGHKNVITRCGKLLEKFIEPLTQLGQEQALRSVLDWFILQTEQVQPSGIRLAFHSEKPEIIDAYGNEIFRLASGGYTAVKDQLAKLLGSPKIAESITQCDSATLKAYGAMLLKIFPLFSSPDEQKKNH
jgi:hypothetical protein